MNKKWIVITSFVGLVIFIAGIEVGGIRDTVILQQMEGDKILIEQLEDELAEKIRENRALTHVLEGTTKEYKELEDSLNIPKVERDNKDLLQTT